MTPREWLERTKQKGFKVKKLGGDRYLELNQYRVYMPRSTMLEADMILIRPKSLLIIDNWLVLVPD